MSFANLQFAYVLLAGLVCLAVLRRWRRRRCFAHSLAHQPLLAQMHPSHLRVVPTLTALLAIVAAGVALMDPRIAARQRFTRFEGLDIVLVVDLSSSMLEALGGWEQYRKMYEEWSKGKGLLERTRDQGQVPMPESRLQAVTTGLADFVSKRRQDRIALVAFSENTYIISPLTSDHRYVDKYIHMIDGNILVGEGITAIGDGIAEGMKMFRREGDPETRNKVIVVFTDGENNFGRDPLEVLSEARYYGYRVYLIGVDIGPEVARKDTVRQLIEAVEHTGGRYFDATDKAQLEEAYRTIDHTERGVLAQRTVERNVPAFQWFAYLSLLFLSIAAVLDAVPYFIEIS